MSDSQKKKERARARVHITFGQAEMATASSDADDEAEIHTQHELQIDVYRLRYHLQNTPLSVEWRANITHALDETELELQDRQAAFGGLLRIFDRTGESFYVLERLSSAVKHLCQKLQHRFPHNHEELQLFLGDQAMVNKEKTLKEYGVRYGKLIDVICPG